MRERTKEFQINGILVLVLFGVFAVTVLAVLLTGAGAYKRLTERGQEMYTARTIPQYLTTRVRQADAAGGISVASMDGIPVLELSEQIEGKRYVTRIYCYEGYVRELFADASLTLHPEDGECIMEAETLRFTLEDGALHITLDVDGMQSQLYLALRSGEVPYEE